MTIKYTGLLCTLLFAPVPGLQAQDTSAIVRRVASTTLLAAQEYRLGIADGKVVLQAEIEEADLFLKEAARTALGLPEQDAREIRAVLDTLIRLVAETASPDSVGLRAERLVAALATRFGVDVDVIPETLPALARGAEVYQGNCARCHGDTGHGDGRDAVGFDPKPTDLTNGEALRDVSPLDYYRRISIGVVGTAMPPFEGLLSPDDRWAAAVYASMMRLPPAAGEVPSGLQTFPTTARMTDQELLETLGSEGDLAGVAAVRSYQAPASRMAASGEVFTTVRRQVDSAVRFAEGNERESARRMAFDAYLTFEAVERSVRASDAGLANQAEEAFAQLRTEAERGSPASVQQARTDVLAVLERAERVLAQTPSKTNLLVQSFIILLREGLEAILVIGAIMAFLTRTGATNRRRDIHIGVAAAVAMSLLTALALETIFFLSPAHQEALEGVTLMVATGMLFYVSYWLLSKMEIGKWNRFVRSRVQSAISSGSALALASAAFLAVYREGFETVLFYKALIVSGGGEGGAWAPVLTGILAAAIVLAVLYVAINRYGVRLPLKPFFGVTSAFLYYMAFVFAGKGIAELQEGGLVGTTVVGTLRVPALGIYPTLESLLAQGLLIGLAGLAVVWIFWVAPRRLGVTQSLVPEPVPAGEAVVEVPGVGTDKNLERSLQRIEADLAEIRAEVERIRSRHQSTVSKD